MLRDYYYDIRRYELKGFTDINFTIVSLKLKSGKAVMQFLSTIYLSKRKNEQLNRVAHSIIFSQTCNLIIILVA